MMSEQHKLMLKMASLVVLAIGIFSAGYFISDNSWSAKWSERDKADALSVVAAQEAERTKERQWQADIQRVHDEAKKRQETIAADAAELSVTANRLRDKIKSMSAGQSGGNSTATNISRSAATDKVVYSVMLESVIVRAEQYAGYADRNREAALTCNAAYNALR